MVKNSELARTSPQTGGIWSHAHKKFPIHLPTLDPKGTHSSLSLTHTIKLCYSLLSLKHIDVLSLSILNTHTLLS